jgi:ribosomal protein S18 acetylase RimI-like enzyme
MAATDEVHDIAVGLQAASLDERKPPLSPLLSREGRTVSISTTATSSTKAFSSAASACSAVPEHRASKTSIISAPCLAQDAILTMEVPVRGPEFDKNEQAMRWIPEIEAASQVAFDENCLEMISKKSKFKLGVLSAPCGDLLGFIVYKINRNQRSFTIGKVAVRVEFRGQGYGKRMVKDVIKIAKKDKLIDFVSLSSLPGSVKFYKRMNFKEFKDIKFSPDSLEEGETFVEGQVYMEFKTKSAGGKRR